MFIRASPLCCYILLPIRRHGITGLIAHFSAAGNRTAGGVMDGIDGAFSITDANNASDDAADFGRVMGLPYLCHSRSRSAPSGIRRHHLRDHRHQRGSS